MDLHRATLFALAALIVVMSSPTPVHVAAQTPAPAVGSRVATAGDLLTNAGWECIPAASVVDHSVTFQPTDKFQGFMDDYLARVLVAGDFTISTELEVSKAFGAVNIWNSLPTPYPAQNWYVMAPKVFLAVTATGNPGVQIFDGHDSKPAFQFFAKPVIGRAKLQLRKTGSSLAFLVNEDEVTRTTVLGPLVDGPLYFGASVGPQAHVLIHSLSVQADPQRGSVRVELSPLFATVPAASPGSDSLRTLFAATNRTIGSGGLLARWLRWSPEYRTVLAQNFNMLADNLSFDWKAIEPARGKYAFCDADQIVEFARENGMKVHAKFVTWGNFDPAWLDDGHFSRDELLDILHQHIQAVVGRYRGKVAMWDVANEVLDYNYEKASAGMFRDTVWSRVIGPDYLDYAFRWTREADPSARLLLNEAGAEGMDRKSDAFYDLVKKLLARHVPIDGVGMQMHWWVKRPGGDRGAPTPKAIAANIKRLSDLGLDVYITEMEVAVVEPVTPEKLTAQAQTYHDITAACRAAPRCKGLTVWGVSDADSWLHSVEQRPYLRGFTQSLLFDDALRPKATYQAVANAIAGR